MHKKLFILCLVLLLPSITNAQTANTGDVVINEIAWMGTKTSGNDEWIELFNSTSKEISFSGWTLASADGKLKIALTGGIPAQGFYLLERTDDNSVPNIPADLAYKGSLPNTGQYLKLYDATNNLVDQANFLEKWPAGNNATKQTMERNGVNWQTSKEALGTPKALNSEGFIAQEVAAPIKLSAEASPKEIAVQEKVSETLTVKDYPTGIVFNELVPAPDGADEEYEWIELYNTNAFEIDLTGWSITDKEGAPTTYTFPKESIIAALGYLVLSRPQSHITLNNDSDVLELAMPNGKTADSLSYTKAKSGQSYSLAAGNWQWSLSPTPGSKNHITTAATKKTSLPKAKKSGNKTTVATNQNKVTNNLNPQLFSADLEGSSGNPWLIFIVALSIAIILATISTIIYLRSKKSTLTL